MAHSNLNLDFIIITFKSVIETELDLFMVGFYMSCSQIFWNINAHVYIVRPGLLRVEEGSAQDLPQDDSEESDSENGPISNEAFLRLFNSDTEADDFSGFSSQEEEDSEDF